MKIYLLFISLLFSIIFNNAVAQDFSPQYNITIWNKDIHGVYVENHLETLGFLPIFKNNQDEITIGNIKIILKSTLNIQVLENKEDSMKVLLNFKNDEKEYKKEIFIKNKEIKDFEDFKIRIEIK